MTVIANTTVISNFSAIGHIELLRMIFDKVYISVQVYEEIMNLRFSGSLGCLILAVEKGLYTMTKANLSLRQMIEGGYHSTVQDLDDL